MPATLTQLVTVRSQLAEAVIDYLRKLEEKLDRTPWFRVGQPMTASGIAAPVRVLKESTRPEPHRFVSGRDDPHEAEEREGREVAQDYVDPAIAALYEEAPREKRQEEVPWPQERLQVHRAVVLGGPGSGKSFLTQTTAIDLARAARDSLQNCRASLEALELPLHCTLARFGDSELAPDPGDTVLELVRLEYSPPPCFLAWLKQRLSSRTTWLLLDALDEVQGEALQTLSTRLSTLVTQGWQTRVLLTCRPAHYSRGLVPWSELTEYELAPFNPLEIRQFVQRWFTPEKACGTALIQALDRNYSLAHAARTPLIATFLCLAHEEAPVSDKTRRVELYGRVVRGLARRAWKATPLDEADPHTDDLVDLLVRVARPLFQLHPAGNLFTHAEVMRVLKDTADRPRARLDGRKETNAPDDLRDELIETGMLVNAGLRDGVETQFGFAHRSLLEYLVARSLNEKAKSKGWDSIREFVDKKSWHPAWRETVLFLAGLMPPDDALALLALLADKSTDDATRQRLCLAGHCLPELTEDALQSFLQASQSKAGPTLQTKLPGIASEILELWWKDEQQNTPFNHVANTLPALGAACAPQLVPGLLRRLESVQTDDRCRGAAALGRLRPAAAIDAVLRCLTERLRDAEGAVANQAAKALGDLGPAAATDRVLIQLIEWLHAAEWPVPHWAAKALGNLGSAAATDMVLHRLTRWLDDVDWSVRYRASMAVENLGLAAATGAVVSCLTEWLRDPHWVVRETAARVLGKLGPAAATEPVLNCLTGWLQDPSKDVRHTAAFALECLGPAVATNEEVLNRLIDSLRDPDSDVRHRAARALGKLGRAAATAEVLRRLTDWLRDADEDTKHGAQNALLELGAAAATHHVISSLAECLRNPSANVRGRAAWLLGNLGPAAATEDVVGRFIDWLYDPDIHVQTLAATVLGRLGPSAAKGPVLSLLTKWMRNSGLQLRRTAVEALGRLGPAAASDEAVNNLTEFLHDSDEYIRLRAVRALGRWGTRSARGLILSRVTDLLNDPDWTVRKSAFEALESFLHRGVRWFTIGRSEFHVTTTELLSGEKSAPDAVRRGSS